VSERIEQSDGDVRYCIDLRINPTGFSFKPSGIFGKDFIIDGYLGTATGNAASLEACRAFISIFRKQYSKVQSYYVGPHALQLFSQGYHLTSSVQTPKKFHLQVSND